MRTVRPLLLLFGALLLLSMALTRFQVTPPTALSSATAPINRVFIVASDNVRRAVTNAVQERNLAREVWKLRRENDRLLERNEMLGRQLARYKQLQKITATQAPNALVTAQIVDIDTSPLLARLFVNKGSKDGVREAMPVTVPAGLVGQIREVTPDRAKVVALVDPESSVGVTLAKNKGGRGIAVGLPPDRLRAQFAIGVPIKVGDVLVTNSQKGVFPTGIRVGKVEKVLPLGPNDLNRRVIIKPAVDINVLEDVVILQGL